MMITTINPATLEPLATYTYFSAEQVETVLATGQDCYRQAWRPRSLHERAQVVRTFAALLEGEEEALAVAMAKEMGKRISEGRAEVAKSVAVLRAVACRANQYFSIGKEADLEFDHDGLDVLIDIEPIGGILAVMPWNFPVWQIMRVFAPNAVGGNVVYLKHAPQVTGTALRLQELWEAAGGPKGVLQTLVVDHDQIPGIIADDRIQGVTLTGSERAGHIVAGLAGQHGKKSVLELGGSDPFIITKDADLETALDTVMVARFANCGQVCTAAKRLIVDRAIVDQVEAGLRARLATLTLGDPLDEQTAIGPLVSVAHRDRLLAQLDAGVAAGARIVAGGQVPDRVGAWMEPTVVTDVTPANPLAQEEVFGPVLVVMVGEGEDALVDLANATRYGLGATVFARRPEDGLALARRIDSGMVTVNAINLSHPIVPFGGTKASGYGRELGPWGAHEFMNIRTVSVRR